MLPCKYVAKQKQVISYGKINVLWMTLVNRVGFKFCKRGKETYL